MRFPTSAFRAAARVPRGRRALVHPRPSSHPFAQPYRHLSSTAVRLSADTGDRKWSTPLAEKLSSAIEATEPMPLARYMRMCLTSDVGGYYTRGDLKEGEDQFGVKGDFVTSPEISQIFGELIGIWFTVEWLCQGRPSSGVEFIEVGPGRGTLMDDILRTIKTSPMAEAVDTIYLVEASAHLREIQKNLLCGADASLTESETGWHSICKHTGRPIIWTETIQSISKPAAKMPFILAHEFFDALPIHAFQRVEVPPPKASDSPSPTESSPTATDTSKPKLEWREMVVTPTPAQPTLDPGNPPPEFQLSLSEAPTSHTQYLAHSSPRMQEFKDTPNATVEVCPDAALYADEFATRIGGTAKHPKLKPSGAALILDYGSDDAPANSLRGIRRHRRVSPFAEPGLVDLSADVDFTAIARAAARASEGVEIHGTIPQAEFLLRMGGKERAEMLMKAGGAERAKVISEAFERLVDQGEGGMGRLYKALAILPENGGKRRPVGFGGDVQ